MIYDVPTQTPSKPLFNKLKWMPIVDRVNYRRSVMVYKALNDMTPAYMKSMFTYVSEVSRRETRYADKTKLYLKTGTNLKAYTDCFQYAAALAWNKIPSYIREKDTIGAFRSAYMKWYFSD